MEQGTEKRLGERELEPQQVQLELVSEDIPPALKDIKAAG